MRDATRAKYLERARPLVEPRTAVAYAIGVQGPDPRLALLAILAGAIAVSAILAATTGAFLFPGIVLIVIIYSSIDRPVSVVTTDDGVAVLRRSMWNGRPQRIIATLPNEACSGKAAVPSRSYVSLPGQRLWLRRGEFDVVLGNLRATPAAVPAAAPVVTASPAAPAAPAQPVRPPSLTPTMAGWYPTDDGSYDQAYWDGTRWSEAKRLIGGGFVSVPVEPQPG
jgi:hypothetical protein